MEERHLLQVYFIAPEKCLFASLYSSHAHQTFHLIKRRPFNPPKPGKTALDKPTCSRESFSVLMQTGGVSGSDSDSNAAGDTKDSLNSIHSSPSFVLPSLPVPSLSPTTQLEHT
jgi:hypothetical protein